MENRFGSAILLFIVGVEESFARLQTLACGSAQYNMPSHATCIIFPGFKADASKHYLTLGG